MKVKGVLAGSGRECFSTKEVCDAVISLTGKPATEVKIAYFGTASWDLPEYRNYQTQQLELAGAIVTDVKLASDLNRHSTEEVEAILKESDVILMSGGNSLFAVDRLKELGVDKLIKKEVSRGCIIAGGSSGVLCWFDGGHSRAANPKMVNDYFAQYNIHVPEKDWGYVRISSFGVLPGLVCPHADRVGEDGVARGNDFERMLLRHRQERGITFDHWSCLVIDGDDYVQVDIPEKTGSVNDDGTFSGSYNGRPGIWIKEVVNGEIVSTPLPRRGKISDVLRPAEAIVEDPTVEKIRSSYPLLIPAFDACLRSRIPA